jgi:hypothetical protein
MRTAGCALVPCAAFAVLLGCAGPEGSAPPTLHPTVHRPLSGSQREVVLIDRYRGERGCKGTAYAAVRRYADEHLDGVVSEPTQPERVAGAMRNGRFRLALAQTAARKRCREVARETYRQVNEIFTGEPYAALRQRAKTGLEALGG